jgi:thymidylate synthase (FAD)
MGFQFNDQDPNAPRREHGTEIACLDHGYVKLVETWGADERIVEAARMSTNKGFLGWGPVHTVECQTRGQWTCICDPKPGDEKLLKYLWENKHATPFEMAGLVIEVQAPIETFRQWHRHRTQCLAGSTELHFDLPGGIVRRGSQLYKRTIQQIVEAFESSDFARNRVRGMLLRSVDEDTHEVIHTKITNAWRSGVKAVYDVTLGDGVTVRMSKDHRVLTNQGWQRLRDFADRADQTLISCIGQGYGRVARELPVFTDADLATEEWRPIWVNVPPSRYEVSNLGRVRSLRNTRGALRDQPKLKEPTPTATGYMAVSLSRDGKTEVALVHTLVLTAFQGFRAPAECRHLDGNGWNNRLANLAWGTSRENADDRVKHGSVPALQHRYQAITSVKFVGYEETFDIEVVGPHHNFSANGMIVHNSYNEMSARYTPLPDVNYIPSVDRLMMVNSANKQAGTIKGADELTREAAQLFREDLAGIYQQAEDLYQRALKAGVSKELARIHLPVGRYSKMRAATNLRNWLAFLTLRMDEHAQWEIQQFANAVGVFVKVAFPRTWDLFIRDVGL